MRDTFPVAWDDPADAALSWRREDMHFPRALLPLAGDLEERASNAGVNHRHEQLGLPVRTRCRVVNGYMYVATIVSVPDADLPAYLERATARARDLARGTRAFWEDTVLPTLRAAYAWMREAPIETAPLGEVAAAWDELWERIVQINRLHWITNVGSYRPLYDLSDLYESAMGRARPGEALTLLQGLPTMTAVVEDDLHRLAELARAEPALAGLVAGDPDAALETLRRTPAAASFRQAFDAFLAAHGHLGQPFDEVTSPSWIEAPQHLLAEVARRLTHPQEPPVLRRQRLAAAAVALKQRVRARLGDRPDERARFDEVLALAREVGPLTEDHNYWLDRMALSNIRWFVLRVGRRLTGAGVLASPGDAFFLHVNEVGEALRAPADRRAFVAARRDEYARWDTIEPPGYLGAPPEPSKLGNRFYADRPEQPEPGMLRGQGASPGVARGPARVVVSEQDFARVQPGDVLVCPSSNPSWVPLFGIIVGLVTNTGGVLSHAAVVAREFGLPAVVGTGNATTAIRDGEIVEVDGDAGMVRLPGAARAPGVRAV